MKRYEEILKDFMALRDEKYRVFNERIANIPEGTSLGIRIPALRKYAKNLINETGFDFETLFSFPEDIFEMRILKCLCVGYAKEPYEEKVSLINACVPRIQSWAECDVFVSTLKDLKKYCMDYRQDILGFAESAEEFTQRYALVILLSCYMRKEYLSTIFYVLGLVNTDLYYVHMGAAWLLAEVLVKFYEEGVTYLKEGSLAVKTKNKGIQKALESRRLTVEQKKYLKSMKNG